MTIRHLEIFRAVCERGGITAAAESLRMTQPAVSIAIRELESYYNTRLFDRVGRRLRLTEEGSRLSIAADSILSQLEDTALLLRDGGSFKRVRIGVNVSVGETLLGELLDRLENEVEGIEPTVFVGNTGTVDRKLAAGELDIAVADCMSQAQDRVIVPYYTGEACAVCSPTYSAPTSMSFAALCSERLLLRESGSGSRIGLEAMAGERGLTIEPITESTSDLCLIMLAMRGFGITVLPRELVSDRLASGELRELELTDARLERRYFLAYGRKRHHTATVAEAIACLTK